MNRKEKGAAVCVTLTEENIPELYLNIQSVPRSTYRLGYENQSVYAV